MSGNSTHGGGPVLARPQAFLIPEHVMAAKEHFLILFHAGFSLSEMQESTGKSFHQPDIKNVILSADKADHEKAKAQVSHIPKRIEDAYRQVRVLRKRGKTEIVIRLVIERS